MLCVKAENVKNIDWTVDSDIEQVIAQWGGGSRYADNALWNVKGKADIGAAGYYGGLGDTVCNSSLFRHRRANAARAIAVRTMTSRPAAVASVQMNPNGGPSRRGWRR